MKTATARHAIGTLLEQKGYIAPGALAKALHEQKRVQAPLGEVLVGRGALRYFDLYRTLAEQQDLPFADLKAEPPAKDLLQPELWQEYVSWRCVPWKQDMHGVTLACVEMTEGVKAYARGRYGTTVRFALTAPYDVLWSIEQVCGTKLSDHARHHLFRLAPLCSALPRRDTGIKRALAAVVSCAVIGGAVALWPAVALPALVVMCNVFYLVTMLFKLTLFTESRRYRRLPSPAMLRHVADPASLPVYTILVPMYREAASVPHLLAAIGALDYPKPKLDVKLIVEADDELTIAAIKRAKPCGMFDIIRVPYSLPRTKPKACNFALAFAEGEFVTIYDVEDKPDPDQLKKAVAAFRSVPENVICLQARLNYFNRKENLLTALFAIEYATLFDFMLPGLAAMHIPIPLGGTSNHFRVAKLRELGEWDPFNVTEDADLGLRLASLGYRTLPLDSLTLEEAPVTLGAWFKQRARWIKGYMITWRVAMRRALTLHRAFGWRGFLGFQLFVGAASLVYLAAPVLWVASALWAFHLAAFTPLPAWVVATSVAVFELGLLLQLVLAVVVARSSPRRWTGMWPAILLFPFYWFLHSFASIRALFQLFTAPFHWDKTEHGISRMLPAL